MYIVKYCKKNWFILSTGVIVLFTFILRFYDYFNRYAIWSDQASFAILGRYAFFNGKLPLLGPFSSAGPFQTGGEWYWIIMLFQAFYPPSVITPWVLLTLSYVVYVFFLIIVANEMLGKRFALIVGVLAAVSTSQISQSVNLTNQSPLAFVTLLCIWFAILYIKRKKDIYLFLLAFCASIGPTIHAQGFLLYIIIPLTVIIARRLTVKGVIFGFIGFLLPWIPVIYADSMNKFSTFQNMFNYYFNNQNPVSYEQLGRRWITYLFVFWPKSFSFIIGGYPIIGYIEIVMIGIAIFYAIVKKTISKEIILTASSFFVFIIIIRYVRTPIFDSYLMTTHTLIFLLLGFALMTISKKNIFIASLLFLIIILGSLRKDMQEIQWKTNKATIERVNTFKTFLLKKYPDKKLAIYDSEYQSAGISQSLALFLYEQNKLSDEGVKIGVLKAKPTTRLTMPVLFHSQKDTYYLIDLHASESGELTQYRWAFMNPNAVYDNVQEWYK